MIYAFAPSSGISFVLFHILNLSKRSLNLISTSLGRVGKLPLRVFQFPLLIECSEERQYLGYRLFQVKIIHCLSNYSQNGIDNLDVIR